MRKARVRLTAPYPTVDTVVKTFRIPAARAQKILAMVDQFVQELDKGGNSARSLTKKPRRKRRSTT